ncbi:DUF7210 family protein [Lysobacter sp. CA199]|uniref:DUF7210 family protein n=1 Tax=Lysobacter sp. CA199 TaxID=3455608 RepID=UPI003F8D565A
MKVKLLKVHNHEGRDCAIGETIEVPDVIAHWLVEQEVIAPIAAASDKGRNNATEETK